jgi:phosphoenolpyruvate-protein phosphotransferase (PTS system enzyme I)
VYTGIPVSHGISFGKAYLLDRSKVCVIKERLEPEKVEQEIERFVEAINTSKNQLLEIKNHATKNDNKFGIILDTYLLLLEDEVLVTDTIKNIQSNFINAEYAINLTLQKFTVLFEGMNDDYMKGKKDDLELVVQRILRNLLGHDQESLEEINEPVTLIAHDLSPADMLVINKEFIKGIVTESGGLTSHVGIIAAALGIPAIVGTKNITLAVDSGSQIIVDAIEGNVIVNPSEATKFSYKTKKVNYENYQKKLLENIQLPSVTTDGHTVQIMANIEGDHNLKMIKEFGGEGIGLYRTEFIYIGRKNLPSEQNLFENFKKVAEDSKPHPVVIRTLDAGGDKAISFLDIEKEENPALGLRGIRMSLNFPEIFKTQLRSILRASVYGNLQILYPMVSSVEELHEANQILEDIKLDLKEEHIDFDSDIEVGAMIETPSSAVCVEEILDIVDFISVGTNDLIQYILAVDRTNETVAHLYEAFHPAIIKTLKTIFDAANKANKKISICGEMGGDPVATLLLLGLGNINQLSMDPHSIPKIKKIIRSIDMNEARKLANNVLSMSSSKEINRYINEEMKKRFPEDFNRNINYQEKLSV